MGKYKIAKTIIASLVTHAFADFNIKSIDDTETVDVEIDDKIYLQENEYLDVDLVSFNGLQYSAKTGFGSSNVEENLLFDTGSNVLWVTSVFCEETGQCDNNYSSMYDPESSEDHKFRGVLRHKDNVLKI